MYNTVVAIIDVILDDKVGEGAPIPSTFPMVTSQNVGVWGGGLSLGV